MARRRRELDMLPLLDVFMVVLFVFATIQEGKVEYSTITSDQLEKMVAELKEKSQELEEALQAANVEETREKLRKSSKALDAEKERNIELTVELDDTKTEREQAEAQAKENQEKLEMVEAAAKELAEAEFESQDALRHQDVLSKLLEQHSVFEVEIRGEVDPEIGVVNHCCVRTDPLNGEWSSCGTVPASHDERLDWFRRGGDGLLKTLRATKGGNAMTIIRQDANATHLIGAKLEQEVRVQIPDQKVYNEGITVIEINCGK